MSPVTQRRMAPLPTIKDLLRMYKINAKKSLSQNFILDPRMNRRIARAAGNLEGKFAIEVGPGPGGITRAILDEGVKRLFVIEKDHRFMPTLNMMQQIVGPDRLNVSIGDCLHYNIQKLVGTDVDVVDWDSPDMPDLVQIGNLPFNVTTPFLIRMLKSMSARSNIFHFGRTQSFLTFQHEVAVRMCSPASTRERCRLSVMCQNWADVHYMFQFPGGAFVPPPKVDVGFVRLTPLRQPYINLPYHVVDTVVSALFLGGKNKWVSNSFRLAFAGSSMARSEKSDWARCVLDMCKIDEKRVATSLNMEEIREICFAYKHVMDNEPVLSARSDSDDTSDATVENFVDTSKIVGAVSATREKPVKYVIDF